MGLHGMCQLHFCRTKPQISAITWIACAIVLLLTAWRLHAKLMQPKKALLDPASLSRRWLVMCIISRSNIWGLPLCSVCPCRGLVCLPFRVCVSDSLSCFVCLIVSPFVYLDMLADICLYLFVLAYVCMFVCICLTSVVPQYRSRSIRSTQYAAIAVRVRTSCTV